MKKLAFLIAVMGLAVAGCDQQGGTSDQYNTSTGTNNSAAPSSPNMNNNSANPSVNDTNAPAAPSQP